MNPLFVESKAEKKMIKQNEKVRTAPCDLSLSFAVDDLALSRYVLSRGK